MPPIELRSARVDDAGKLAVLWLSAWETGRLSALDAGRSDPAMLLTAVGEFCSEYWQEITVATEDGEPVGWGAREDGDAYISDLWVTASAQGRGVGSALLARLESDIASAGYAVATLNTRAGNIDAIRFYRHHGYVVTDTYTEFSSTLNYEIEKLRFAKTLSPPAGGETQEPRS